jgi:hypothetical protein
VRWGSLNFLSRLALTQIAGITDVSYHAGLFFCGFYRKESQASCRT